MKNVTTIKVDKITRGKLANLNFVKKDNTFDEIINKLIDFYDGKKKNEP